MGKVGMEKSGEVAVQVENARALCLMIGHHSRDTISMYSTCTLITSNRMTFTVLREGELTVPTVPVRWHSGSG